MSLSILYAGVWASPHDMVAVGVAGVISGVASAYLDVRWSQVYGLLPPETSGRVITFAMALGIAGYFVLSSLGIVVSPYACVVCIALLPFGCVVTLQSSQRMLTVTGIPTLAPPTQNARQIATTLWRPVAGSLIFFFIFGCSSGIVGERTDLNITQGFSLACELVALLILFACLYRRPRLSVTRVYEVALVLVAAGFMVLPLAIRAGAP